MRKEHLIQTVLSSNSLTQKDAREVVERIVESLWQDGDTGLFTMDHVEVVGKLARKVLRGPKTPF